MAHAVEPDVGSIVARTSRSYDALPYTSNPFPNTNPSQLGAIARLFAIEAAPLGEARVLELGCASGGNIIPLAARNPKAAFVGFDLSHAQIEAGRARIARLGLSNVALRQRNFADIETGEAPFDYIICHGVYSWVPAPIRDAILRLCRENLSPRGVALVSYNVLPGWRLLQGLRDCLHLHSAPEADPAARAAAARALLRNLPEACSDAGPYKDLITRESARLLKCSDDYLVHEFLDDVNEPCTFREFAGAAHGHGLAYLGEAELSSMILANYPAAAAEFIAQAGGNRLLDVEQYIDIVSGRVFRQTLLVGLERAAQIERALSDTRAEALYFAGASGIALTRGPDGVTLATPAARRLHTGSAVIAEALTHFVAASPGSSNVEDMMAVLPPAAQNAESRALLRSTLLNMAINGLAIPLLDPIPATGRVTDKPVACPFVRAEAAQGAQSVVNMRHERVDLQGLAHFVLPLLDGRRDVEAVGAAIADATRDGRLAFARGGQSIGEDSERLRIATDRLRTLLPELARAALLVG